MSAIEHELASQPDALAAGGRRSSPIQRSPRPGERVAVIGCGTSLYMAQAYAARARTPGTARPTPSPRPRCRPARAYDAVIAISRSGTTTEVVAALAACRRALPTIADHGGRREPARATPPARVVVLASPTSGRSSRPGSRRRRWCCCARTSGIDSGRPRTRPSACSRRRCPIDPAAFDRFAFLGAGWTVGLAAEAALKLREAARAWTESYPAMEYRHGPIATADERTLVVAIGAVDADLAGDVRATGAAPARRRARSRWRRWCSCQRLAVASPSPAASIPTPPAT